MILILVGGDVYSSFISMIFTITRIVTVIDIALYIIRYTTLEKYMRIPNLVMLIHIPIHVYLCVTYVLLLIIAYAHRLYDDVTAQEAVSMFNLVYAIQTLRVLIYGPVLIFLTLLSP